MIMSEVEEIGRLVLECDWASDDPEPWEALLRYMERKGYNGRFHGTMQETLEQVRKVQKALRFDGLLLEFSEKIKAKGLVLSRREKKSGVDFLSPEAYKIRGEFGSRPICGRESLWRQTSTPIPFMSLASTPVVCGACMKLISKPLRDTETHSEIMGMANSMGLLLDYPWDWNS